MAVDELPELGCGRTTEQVWAGIGRPPDQHERDCEYCQQARQQLALLDRAIRSVRELAPQTEQPRARVKNAIMDIARSEIRQGRRIPLERPGPLPSAGSDTPVDDAELGITERALIAVVTQAADRVPAARTRHVRVAEATRPVAEPEPTGLEQEPTGIEQEPTGIEQEPTGLDISITASIRFGAGVVETVDQLRDEDTAAIGQLVGITVHRIDVVVEDVHAS
jgi:hypothetical protein